MFIFTGYNQSYMVETNRKVGLPISHDLYRERWDLVKTFCDGGALLDYGCAGGAFHMAAPDGFDASGWDINPCSGFCGAEPCRDFDILTMWDVMEHLPAPLNPVIRYSPDTVFISTPNAETVELQAFNTWKHFKPIEHLYYFTPATLTMSMASVGYKLICLDYSEGQLRDPQNPEAIFTAVYAKCLTN